MKDVMTNLSRQEYEELMHCLDSRRPGEFETVETNMFASDCQWTFDWRGNRYRLSESFEVVYDVQKITDNPMLPRPPEKEEDQNEEKFKSWKSELVNLIEEVFG